MRRPLSAAILGAFIAIGIVVAAQLLSDAVQQIEQSRRVVEVKGLAERNVPANLALLSLGYSATADTLAVLHKRMDQQSGIIRAFLRERGFDDDEIIRGTPEITDRSSYNKDAGERYAGKAVIMVRTKKVKAARATQQQTDTLVAKGVTLNRNYQHATQYQFTQLNKIKPDMIAQATRNARKAAQRFAHDSGSKVGSIKHARQGYFTIKNRDPLSPQIKHVRVVTTVDYYLTD